MSSPDDLMKGQEYAHDHTSQVTHDFVNRSLDHIVKGFDYELADGNSLDITINRTGRIYTKAGLSFELLDDETVTLANSDETHPRIDLIVAKLEDEVDAESNLIPFVRLRTPEQFEDEVQPYAPVNYNAATELHWRATILVKTGTPGAIPALPSYDENEVPLYSISVPADSIKIGEGAVQDLRVTIADLQQLNTYRSTDRADINGLLSRVLGLEGGSGNPDDPTTAIGRLIAELRRQIIASADLPDIRYDRPKYDLTDKRTSQILATGGSASSVPYVDLELGGRVNFGDAEVAILPQKFADQSVNPRLQTVGSPSNHTRRDVTLNLAGVTQISSDGTSALQLKGAVLPVARAHAGIAARNGQFVEIFGGLSSAGAALSDWYTYDILNDTLTPRTPGTALPASRQPTMIPYGDGTDVLMITGDPVTQDPQVFRVNCSTMAVTEITGTIPTGRQFVGDLIGANKIFIVALKKVGDDVLARNAEYWEYNTSSHMFTQITPTGVSPLVRQDAVSGCYYAEGKFVMLFGGGPDYVGGGEPGAAPVVTYIYDSPTTQWTQINIPQPTTVNGLATLPLKYFRLANVEGRPTLVQGSSGGARLWELITSAFGIEWRSATTNLVAIQNAGFCSMLGATSRANGRGVMAGGVRIDNDAGGQTWLTSIYLTSKAGLIAAAHGGETGISVGAGATTVQFEIPLYTASFQVLGYQAEIVGANLSQMLVEVSLDDGDHWHTIELGRTFAVADSDTPGARRLRVTMYRSGSTAPIITKLTEILDNDADALEVNQVIRFNTPTSGAARALYIDRDGVVTISTTIEPSTPQKAIICKFTPNTTAAPTINKKYINRRRPIIRYTGERASGTTPSFSNELAVPVRHVNAFVKKASDGSVYKIDEPTIAFDASTVAVSGVGANGDIYYIDIAG